MSRKRHNPEEIVGKRPADPFGISGGVSYAATAA